MGQAYTGTSGALGRPITSDRFQVHCDPVAADLVKKKRKAERKAELIRIRDLWKKGELQ